MGNSSQDLRQAFGYLLEYELPALKETIESLPDNSLCINIGAGSGTSGLAFLESQQVKTLYTIDLYRAGRPEGALENEMNALRNAGYSKDARYHQLWGDSAQVGLIWTKGLVDMVFIDGDHSYEHCRSDIESWLPNIKPGGVLAVHDYDTKSWPGVKKAVDELLIPRYEIISSIQTYIAFRIK